MKIVKILELSVPQHFTEIFDEHKNEAIPIVIYLKLKSRDFGATFKSNTICMEFLVPFCFGDNLIN